MRCVAAGAGISAWQTGGVAVKRRRATGSAPLAADPGGWPGRALAHHNPSHPSDQTSSYAVKRAYGGGVDSVACVSSAAGMRSARVSRTADF